MTNVRTLIDKNRWDDVLKLIKRGKIDINKPVVGSQTLAHLAAAKNETNVLHYLADNQGVMLAKSDNSGTTPVHILAKYSYTDTLQYILNKYPEFSHLKDNKERTLLYLINKDTELSPLFKKLVEHTDLNTIVNGETVLNSNIKKTVNSNDNFYKKIVMLVENGSDINIPVDNPPLLQAVKLEKINIVKYLIDKKADVNITNSDYVTPLLSAVNIGNLNIVKLLVDNKADINFNGAEGDYNMLTLAVHNNQKNILKYLLKKGSTTDSVNRYLKTAIHSVLSTKQPLSTDTVTTLIYYSDMNILDKDNVTPLSLLIKNHNWKNYKYILKSKKLDIFNKDKNNISPIELVKTEDLPEFIDVVVDSYINHMDNSKNNNITNRCQNVVDQQCKNIVKKHIFSTKKSYFQNNSKLIKKQLSYVEGDYTNSGKFNSDAIHSMIYTVVLLKKYKMLGIPYQYYNKDKFITDKILHFTHITYEKKDHILSELIRIYTNYFYEILPYFIVWCDKDMYRIDKNLDFYMNTCLHNKTVRFILLKLTLVASSNGTHANIVVFDKKTGILERFEPYGVVPYIDGEQLDIMIEDKIGGIFQKYLDKTNRTLEYLSPKKYIKNVSFQIVSDDSNPLTRKLGDPVGYCLAWTFWYLELRLNNPDIHPSELVKIGFDTVLKYDSKYPFIDFIRNYASKLDSMKNKFLTDAGVDKKMVYSTIFTDADKNKIIDHLVKTFNITTVNTS